MKNTDDYYMKFALNQASIAASMGEVPVGAVVVNDAGVISLAYNRRESDKDPSAHAEFLAIREASKKLGRWRLSDCTVFVTMEPCIMCAGLMHQARIARCVYGVADKKAGALESLYSINEDARLNHNFVAKGGVMDKESKALIHTFFKTLRSESSPDFSVEFNV